MAKRKKPPAKQSSPSKAKRKSPKKKAPGRKGTASAKGAKGSARKKRPPQRSPLEVAQVQRHLKLLEKVQRGRGLSARELKELEQLEALRNPRPAKAAGGPVVIPKNQREIYVTTNDQVARPFGVDQRTVQNWKRDDAWPTSKRPPMDFGAVVAWRLREAEVAGAEPKDDPLSAARARRVNAWAELEELKLAQARNEVIGLEEVRATFRWLFGRLRQMAGTLARADAEFGKEFNLELIKIREDFEKEYGRPESPATEAST